tara:strand:+ start:683 stop:829 length:147 start_codon:yes stop_codon:yes gene_type:complete
MVSLNIKIEYDFDIDDIEELLDMSIKEYLDLYACLSDMLEYATIEVRP